MKIKSFTPTSEWYFVFQNAQGKKDSFQLAGFAVIEGKGEESDQVVGMVPVTGGGRSTTMTGTCSLSKVPSIEGTYKRFTELDEKQAENSN